jgi:hypothetical protein
MAELETEFRGYRIRYSENEDVWRCHSLDMDGANLTQLKNKIGRYLAKIAKTAETVPAIVANYGDQFEYVEIVSVANTLNYNKQPQLWTTKERQESYRGGTRTVKDRAKYDAASVILDTPENRVLVEAAEVLIRQAAAAKKKATEAVRLIPRVDVSTLRPEQEDTES